MSHELPKTFCRWRVNPGRGFDGLEQVTDTPLAAPKRGQVVVKVHAVSLQYRDLAVAKGLYPAEMPQDVSWVSPCGLFWRLLADKAPLAGSVSSSRRPMAPARLLP